MLLLTSGAKRWRKRSQNSSSGSASKGSHAGEKLAKFEAELRGEFEQTVKTIKDRF